MFNDVPSILYDPLTLMECVHGPVEDFGCPELFERVPDFRNKMVLWRFLSEWGTLHNADELVRYINLCSPARVSDLRLIATNRVPPNYCPTCRTLRKNCLL